MNINWLFLGLIALNLTFAIIADVCSKLWGITDHSKWLYIGLLSSLVTIPTFMTMVRLSGLIVVPAVVLLLNIIIDVGIGLLIFSESVNAGQWIGIVLGLVAIPLILGIWGS